MSEANGSNNVPFAIVPSPVNEQASYSTLLPTAQPENISSNAAPKQLRPASNIPPSSSNRTLKPEKSKRRSFLRKFWLLCKWCFNRRWKKLLIAIVGIGVYLAWTAFFEGDAMRRNRRDNLVERGDKFDSQTIELMKQQLKIWYPQRNEEKSAAQDSTVINDYFNALSAPVFNPPTEFAARHPDYVFAMRFPPKMERESKEWTERVLSKRLAELLGKLQQGEKIRSSNMNPSSKELVDEIGKTVNHETWLKASLDAKPLKCELLGEDLVFPADSLPPKAVTDFVNRFVRLSSKQDSASAKKMVRQLNLWKVKGVTERDAEIRPYFVFKVYFHFLWRHEVAVDFLQLDEAHSVFLSRLPSKPIGQGKLLATDAELKSGLKELVRSLVGDDGSPLAASQLLLVKQSLNFSDWYREVSQNKTFSVFPEKQSRLILKLVSRFKTPKEVEE